MSTPAMIRSLPVLIVEDSETDSLILHQALRALGFEYLHHAPDGACALTKVDYAIQSGKPYQLIFLDLQLPKLNGEKFLRALGSELKGTPCRVIAISGSSDIAKVKSLIDIGLNEYVVKPVRLGVLREKLIRLGLIPPEVQAD